MKWLGAFHQESNQKQGHRREQTRPNDESQHIGWLIFPDFHVTTAPAYCAKNDQRSPHRRYASVSNGKYGYESCKCHAHTGNLVFGNPFAKNESRKNDRKEGAELQNQGRDTGGETQIYPQINDSPKANAQ